MNFFIMKTKIKSDEFFAALVKFEKVQSLDNLNDLINNKWLDLNRSVEGLIDEFVPDSE